MKAAARHIITSITRRRRVEINAASRFLRDPRLLMLARAVANPVAAARYLKLGDFQLGPRLFKLVNHLLGVSAEAAA